MNNGFDLLAGLKFLAPGETQGHRRDHNDDNRKQPGSMLHISSLPEYFGHECISRNYHLQPSRSTAATRQKRTLRIAGRHKIVAAIKSKVPEIGRVARIRMSPCDIIND